MTHEPEDLPKRMNCRLTPRAMGGQQYSGLKYGKSPYPFADMGTFFYAVQPAKPDKQSIFLLEEHHAHPHNQIFSNFATQLLPTLVIHRLGHDPHLANRSGHSPGCFGTTTKARVTYDIFEQQLRKKLPEQYRSYAIKWAFTSEIVRERANQAFAEQGQSKRFLSLPQVLANLENEGYRKVVIQPLHIFPGQEYMDVQKIIAAFEQIGLRIESGGAPDARMALGPMKL